MLNKNKKNKRIPQWHALHWSPPKKCRKNIPVVFCSFCRDVQSNISEAFIIGSHICQKPNFDQYLMPKQNIKTCFSSWKFSVYHSSVMNCTHFQQKNTHSYPYTFLNLFTLQVSHRSLDILCARLGGSTFKM